MAEALVKRQSPPAPGKKPRLATEKTRNVGLLKRMQGKVTEINPEQNLLFLHCVIHQELQCSSALEINHVVNVVTKVVNFIRARALNHRQFVALLGEDGTEQADPGYHTAVRCFSWGKVLKTVWGLKSEIQGFSQMKGQSIPEQTSAGWLAGVVFVLDLTAHMKELNSKLQGKRLFEHKMYSLFKAFTKRLLLLSRQVESNTLTRLPTREEKTPICSSTVQICSHVEGVAR
ncbi:general transcription factor II-I repeat domain-containing protein 2-like [Trachinotus anak]|uniref:general transcription factor II-I repeat domain-containing protein 2-like n=1 Tax=Trachinotus anak TaxID=443729 RepID=UPI0039F22F65